MDIWTILQILGVIGGILFLIFVALVIGFVIIFIRAIIPEEDYQ